ncbi:MAG: class I SAM-dependent methyltransferase [Methanotrichaceae archaeon]|nr:class I SAM-dependent methyltransferase [Methanotrichaceae archaeon]
MNHVRKGISRVARLIGYSISEALNGNSRIIWRYLLFKINLLVHRIDLNYVSIEDLGLSEKRSIWMENSGGPILESILNQLGIGPTDSIIDLGCGKGGAIITFAKFPFRKIAGLDISLDMIRVAQDNFLKLRIDNTELYCCDAGNFLDLDEFNYIYMFNPFKFQVMEEVMSNLCDSAMRNPRSITIIYRNPVCHKVIMKNSTFKFLTAFDERGEIILNPIYKKLYEDTGDTYLYRQDN